ncbi:uncharacterized protein LOC116989526 [Amblyraja radiata]|uniref:uncharacterized protein LOC116989526 n=1 Tax=Amblyraja radiata TaxID=386614 RepID=UPI0014038855|nr:uncharacterized protein LOC116989526 [Amblyraja radiata]
MKTLAIIVFLLHVEWSLGTKCNGTVISSKGIAYNCSLHCLDWAKLELEGMTSLSLEGCGISRMINISINKELKELNLKNNKLTGLPPTFLKNFPKLKKLNLIGNPLATIPLNLIETIHVDFTCSCQILKDVNRNCRAAINCTEDFLNNITCTGSNDTQLPAMANFYKAECPDLSLVYILVPVLCVFAIALVVAVLVLVKYRSKLGSHFSPTPSKRQSVNSADQGHQRYASTGDWKDQAAMSPGAHANYENVFMGEPQNARKQQATDDTYYLENDATCEVYQNEQPVYCNYSGPAPTAEDDIYIIADQ